MATTMFNFSERLNTQNEIMSKKTTKSKQTNVAALAKANKFDSGALPRNRDGYCTAGQRTKLFLTVISIFISSLVGIGFGGLFVATGWLVFPKEDLYAEWLRLLLSILAVGVGLWWLYASSKQLLGSWSSLLMDAVEGKLAIEEGPVQKDYDDTHYKSMWHELLDWGFVMFTSQDDKRFLFNMVRGTHFYLANDRQFIVSQKGYNALEDHKPHILYFAPRSKKLINMEPK
jgi:hypothetical protein